MKENYINKLKSINNDLKISLQKTKDEGVGQSKSTRKESASEKVERDLITSEVISDFKPNAVVSEFVNEAKESEGKGDSPLISKKVHSKKSEMTQSGLTKRSSQNSKQIGNNRNSQKMRKSDLFKRKNNEMPLIKNRSKRNTKDLRNKTRGSHKSKNEDRKSEAPGKSIFNSNNSQTSHINGVKIKSEKQTGRTITKKSANVRQYGRTTQRKSSQATQNTSTKKASKGGLANGKYNSKTSTTGKGGLNGKQGDDEKPPQKPNHKLEKGHYLKDGAPTTKDSKAEGNKSKVKIKRSSNGLASRNKSGSHTTKSQTTNKNLTSMNNIPKEEIKKSEEGMFEPDRAIKKKVAKKKNFSLNLDTFKNKIKKDYQTSTEKFMMNMQKNVTPKKNGKVYLTEKPGVKNNTSNFHHNVESESDSAEFDYNRGDSLKAKSNTKIPNATDSKKKGRNRVSQKGDRPGTSQSKNANSQHSNNLSTRKSSKNRFSMNKNNMSANYRNHMRLNEKNQNESSSKKVGGDRNPSNKDFTRRKNKNLSISMNKRVGLNTINLRKKSNDPGNTRKKNQSINPNNRFNQGDALQRKRAVSETHSVSNISFTNIEKAGIRKTKNIVDYIKQREHTLPPFTRARSVVKEFGIIKAFIVNTHKGTVRAGNEDRVSILLNAQHKFRKSKKKMNNCAMFSVFDGHGGTDCCNFLKENLHNKILADLEIHEDFDDSMKKIFREIDSIYLKRAIKKKQNYAGSCANCVFILDEEVVIVNTGDSRTICSKNRGQEVESMSIDHKPGAFSEFSRVITNGGQLYRVSSNLKTIENMFYTVTNYSDVLQIDEIENTNKNLCFGPWRIKPGGLSVSR